VLHRLRPSPEGAAAAAAAGGDPAPLLLALSTRRPVQRRTHRPWGARVPVHMFLREETAGATLLVAAIVVALVWTNSPVAGSYEAVWTSVVSVDIAGAGLALDLRTIVNEGLMTLFFLVVGLEAKRELDLGELRDRRRLTVPALAGMAGIGVSIAVYLAMTAGRTGAGGWGVAASSDTALALGALTVATAGGGDRLRVFLLTVLVVDDLVALAIIALVYPADLDPTALALSAVLVGLLMGMRAVGPRVQASQTAGIALFGASVLVGIALWVALFESGVDPVISGLFVGLVTTAYTPRRDEVEHGSELVHELRERPTPAAAYHARASLTGAISPNERLQYRLHPWTSRVIVPAFALANAGLALDAHLLHAAATSPVTWGIVLAFIVGKPAGILFAAWATAKGAPRTGKLPVSWRGIAGTASSAGVGFTVSLLIASRAFAGTAVLEQAKVGILATVLLSPILAAAILRPLRARRDTAPVPGLAVAVDPLRDHIRGDSEAPVTLVAYMSLGCAYSAAATGVIPELLTRFEGELRYVLRLVPRAGANARLAVAAAEAAASQGAFWAMHDRLVRQDTVTIGGLYRAARRLGLDLGRFFEDLDRQGERVADRVREADASGVTGTPTVFLNGRRYDGPLEPESLGAAIAATGSRIQDR